MTCSSVSRTVAPRNGGPAGQQLVQDRAQGVDVGERPDLLGLALGLLGGHVAGRAQDRVGRRQAASVQRLGQAEVGDLGRAVGGQQDVARLQVAMDDSMPVRLGDAARPASRPARPPAGPARACRRASVQAAALDVLQLEERQAVGLADVVDLDDVGVLQPGDRLGLGQEADRCFGPAWAPPGSSSGAGAIQQDLTGLVHHAHAATAQLAQDLVALDRGDDEVVASRAVADCTEKSASGCRPTVGSEAPWGDTAPVPP